eukprot:3307249-Amphidinium_carterae.1
MHCWSESWTVTRNSFLFAKSDDEQTPRANNEEGTCSTGGLLEYQNGTWELPELPTLIAGNIRFGHYRTCRHLSLMRKHGFQMCNPLKQTPIVKGATLGNTQVGTLCVWTTKPPHCRRTAYARSCQAPTMMRLPGFPLTLWVGFTALELEALGRVEIVLGCTKTRAGG